MPFPDFVWDVRTQYLGDIMVFYIAQRTKNNGTFQLWEKDGQPHEFRDVTQALSSYETAVRLEGMRNVLLLEDVAVRVDLTISKIPD